MTDERRVIVFDGVCNLCNSTVNFIIKRDPNNAFVFSPMQSRTAQELLEEFKATEKSSDTFILIKNGRCFYRSDAALEISKDLTGLWNLMNVFKVLPRGVRDFFYDLVAKNRYRIFGKKDVCMVPSDDVSSRFLG